MKRFLRNFVRVLVVPTVMLGVACSDLPMSAEPAALQAPLFNTSTGGLDLEPLAKFEQRPTITIAWAKKWIGPEGGRLDFQGFAIDVPAGAVDRVTQFSIRLPVDPQGSERVVAEFGPHGATFRTPVSIELPFAGTSIQGSATPTVVWWNESWVNIGAVITSDGARLRAQTDHFSTYGTTESRGVVITSGG